MLSLKMVKLFLEKMVQKVDHRWRSPLVQKEEMTWPVIKGWAGEPFSNLALVPSASSSTSSQCPDTQRPTPLPLEPDVDPMNFD